MIHSILSLFQVSLFLNGWLSICRRKQDEVQVLEETIRMRSEKHKKAGVELNATCHICLKTKFADGVGHICNYCDIRCCARCGGKVTLRSSKVRGHGKKSYANKRPEESRGQIDRVVASICPDVPLFFPRITSPHSAYRGETFRRPRRKKITRKIKIERYPSACDARRSSWY